MSRTKSLWLIAGAALSMGAAAMAQNTLDQSRAYSNELLADSAGRTSALAQGGRSFSVDVHGYTQFRYVWTHLDDDALEDDNAIGFQTTRTRLSVSGNIINEDWGYFIQGGFSPSGEFSLLDAYGTFRMENGWNIMFGQFKLPLLREELVSAKHQLAHERSVMNATFTGGRSQGIQFGFEGDATRFMIAFSDGLGAANTDYVGDVFGPTPDSIEADWALTGRLEWKWAGDWKQFRDFTSFPNSDFAGMVGFAGHFQQGGDTVGTVDTTVWLLTADVSIEGNGWNVFGAGVYQNNDPDAIPDVTDWAWLVQAGFFVAPQLEIFGRFDMLIPDGDRMNDDNFQTLTVGINHYFVPESHVAKFTAALVWYWDNPAQSIPPFDTRLPLLPSNEDGQFSILGQMQLVF